MLERYCFKCHGNKRAKAEVNLEALGTRPDFFRDGRTWEKVHHMLHQREMPPEKKPQPTEDERILLTEFIDAQLVKFDCSNLDVPVNPGRVTLRRLNRSEYNNTIRDLFGVDYQPAADFPNDEVGYGFDNIGDVHPDTYWWQHTVGNVRRQSFRELWMDNPEPLLIELRQHPRAVTGRCAECRWLSICNGNTRTRAWAEGYLWGEDRGCYLSDQEIDLPQPQCIPSIAI